MDSAVICAVYEYVGGRMSAEAFKTIPAVRACAVDKRLRRKLNGTIRFLRWHRRNFA